MVSIDNLLQLLVLLGLICTTLALPVVQQGASSALGQDRVTANTHPYLATFLQYTRLEKEWPEAYIPTYIYHPQQSARSTGSSNVSGMTMRLDTSNLRGPWDKLLDLYKDYVMKEPRLTKRGYDEILYHGRSQGKIQQLKDFWKSMQFKRLKITKTQYRETVEKYRPSSSIATTRSRMTPIPRKQPVYKRWWQRLLTWRKTSGRAATTQNYRREAARYAT